MTPLIDQLHDIEGLDAIGYWPLAIGWWAIIGCAMILLGCAMWLLKRRLDYVRSWKRDTIKKLERLEKNLSPATSKETIIYLSEYLRRIAVQSFPRKECAGLVGKSWLKWLTEHDPEQFDWSEKAVILITIPYAPEETDVPPDQIKELIQAARNWIC